MATVPLLYFKHRYSKYYSSEALFRLPLFSTSVRLMDCGGLDHYYSLFIHCHMSMSMIPSGHMTSIFLSILARDPPPVALLKGSSLFSR